MRLVSLVATAACSKKRVIEIIYYFTAVPLTPSPLGIVSDLAVQLGQMASRSIRGLG